MKRNQRTRKLLIEHYTRYPKLQIQDILKFIFQSSFGCNHMLSSLEFVTDCIKKEATNLKQHNNVLVEQLDGYYSRVNLSYLEKGLSAETLGKLFYVSAKKEKNGLESLLDKISTTKELIKEGLLPFSIENFNDAVYQWSEKGYPAIHHSNIFRDKYNPAYRVIADKYIPLLPLFSNIDKNLKNSSVAIIINNDNDKKTDSLIEIILEVYDANITYIDDCQTEKQDSENDCFLNKVSNYINQKYVTYYPEFNCRLVNIESSNDKNKLLTIIKCTE